MYQSLYRKYRPKNFNEVVGQEVVVKTLIHTIMKNKLNHAYLFTGPRGTGKTSVAKILAKTINCESSTNAIPCENCVNCRQFNNKQINDIIEIDAASNNGVDEIRELKNKISIVPSNGKYKVYIIDEVHMLTIGAFNALLKTLEEPPSHVIFILATTDPHKIPSTILSRCQRFDFKKIGVNDIKLHLKYICEIENVKISDDALYELARISDGGMRDALSLLDQVISYADNDITIEDIHEINGTISQNQLKILFESLVNKDITQIFKIIDEYDKNGKNFIKITDEFILFLRNILLFIETPDYFKTICQNIEFYNDISSNIEIDNIIKYIELLNQGLVEMKLSNNPKLNLEINFIKIMNQKNYLQGNTKETKNIVQSIKIKKDNNSQINRNIDSNKMEKLKKIRVNNTLCNFDKKLYLKNKTKLEDLNQYILQPEYSNIVAIVLDGELKASGKNYLIFVFNNQNDSDLFNENLVDIDKILSSLLNDKIHSISVSTEEWGVIKNEFNNHLKEYEYVEETDNDINFLKKDELNSNTIENSFEDLIEYN